MRLAIYLTLVFINVSSSNEIDDDSTFSEKVIRITVDDFDIKETYKFIRAGTKMLNAKPVVVYEPVSGEQFKSLLGNCEYAFPVDQEEKIFTHVGMTYDYRPCYNKNSQMIEIYVSAIYSDNRKLGKMKINNDFTGTIAISVATTSGSIKLNDHITVNYITDRASDMKQRTGINNQEAATSPGSPRTTSSPTPPTPANPSPTPSPKAP